jgi:hypothetical protein
VGNVIDFDAFRAEQTDNKQVIAETTVRIGGVDYPLASSLPAIIVLDVIRLKDKFTAPKNGTIEDIEVPVEMAHNMGAAMFGEDAWKEILTKHQVGIEQVPDLLRMALSAYVDDPKALAQIFKMSELPSDSSSSGLSSSPTSSESTDSIS